jgi:hypothetical protein
LWSCWFNGDDLAIESKTILTSAVQVITLLFAAFSGYLKWIAPPEEADAKFAVGIASFLALLLLLFAKSLGGNLSKGRHKRLWLTIASVCFFVSIASALSYKYNSEKLTFAYPPESAIAQYVGGSELTPEASAYRKQTNKTPSEIVAAYGGLAQREKVWESRSIRAAKLLLISNYLALTLSLACSIFCLTEGLLGFGTRRRNASTKLGRDDTPRGTGLSEVGP